MGFRCARCGTYVGDDEQYWYNDYGYFCSERCAAFVLEQREREDEDREAAAEAAAAQTRAAERAARSAKAQEEYAQRAAEAAEEQLELARETAEREAKHREHEAMLAKCINIGGAYYSADKTTLVELDKNVRELTVQEGTKFIKEYSCYERDQLKSVTFPESLEEIEKAAFSVCSALTSVTFAQNGNLKKIGKWAFDRTGVTEIDIPEGVEEIGETAFISCTALKRLNIPKSVKKYGKWAFQDCTSLTDVTIADGAALIGEQMFRKCTALKSIRIPDSVSEIEDSAFYECTALDSIAIPASIKKMGNYAFFHCTALTSITIPNGVTEIPQQAFLGCTALSSVSYKGTLKKIGERAFKNCTALTKVDDLLAHVEDVGGGAFQNTGITELTIPANVKTGSYDEEINGEKYTRGAFACCEKLTKVTIAEGKVALGSALFVYCKNLTSVTLPASLKKIRWGAFKNCSSLESIKIPSGVELIEASAFCGCEKLPSIKIPSNISAIEKSTFWGCKKLTSVTIPNSVTKIGEFAFQRCESLASVTFPSSVKSIGKYAFSYCDSLTSVSIPNSVKEIGEDAFRECNSLVSVSVPRGIKEIDAFYGCKRLRRLPIGGGRTKANSKYEPHTPVEKLLYKLWGTKKAKKRAIIILACLALVFLIKYAMGGEARFAKKAQKNFDSWYTSEADAIVGQTYTYNSVDSSSGEISVKTQVPFDKNGFAYGDEMYTVDTAARTVDSETRDGDKYRYAYFPDGSAFYYVNDDGSAGMAYTKEGAQFNAAQATEVIGKTFSGKWSDKFTADITFGADGTATVKFSDGDTGTGSYIASDEDNIVLYNHRDKGVWHKFVYGDDSDDVTFKRYYAKKLRNGRFDTSVSTDTHDDWKRK